MGRQVRSLLALGAAIALSVVAGAQEASIGPDRKIISGGADNPTADRVRRDIELLERVPLDGICINLYKRVDGKVQPFHLRVMDPVPIRFEDFAEAIADLKATRFQRFSDNFLWVWIASPDNVRPVDFFADDYGVVVENWRTAARLAKEGGYRGLFVDTEQYNPKVGPFAWERVDNRMSRTPFEYAAQARQRGREVMTAVNEVYPDIHMLWFFGYAANGAARPRTTPYAFVPDFIDGMIDVAGPDCRIIDGYEQSYGYKTAASFQAARTLIKDQMRQTSPDPGRFDAVHRAGFGIWMDCHGLPLGWDPANFLNNYYTPEEFEYTLHQALWYTDEYVWLWFERGSLLTGSNVPWPYFRAIEAARGPHPTAPAVTPKSPPDGLPAPLQVGGYAGEDLTAVTAAQCALLGELPQDVMWRPDAREVGFELKWYAPDFDDSKGWRRIRMGEFWATSGYKYEPGGWYRIRWDVPALPAGKRTYLAFESVDETMWLWVNGQQVDPARVVRVADGKPLFVDVTGMLNGGGANTVAVRTRTRIEFGGAWRSVKLFADR